MSRTRVACAALVFALAAGLTGCSFIGDVAEGQRITNERLGVADALRVLVDELNALEQVETASYHFDAIDVTTKPGVEVELTTTDATDWGEAVDLIGEAAQQDAFEGYPIGVQLTAGALRSSFSTEYGVSWLTQESLAAAGRLGVLFPTSRLELWGMSQSSAAVSVVVPETAEELLTRVAGDAEVRAFLAGLDPERVQVGFGAAGLSLSGAPDSAEGIEWLRDRLSSGLSLYPTGFDADAVYPTEWVEVSIEGPEGDRWLSLQLVGDTELGSGPAWDELVEVLTTPLPQLNGPGACVPFQVFYSWPGVRGNWPSFVNECVEWGANGADPDRPSLVALREALVASGVDLDTLGFTLS
ncbi:MAG: hypothetical protein QM598_12265 [Protaetiibacter sp.]